MAKKPAAIAPNTKHLKRNLLMDAQGVVWAGYRVAPVRWDFTEYDRKSAALTASADVYASLTGRFMRERVSSRPHPVEQWARQLDSRTPDPIPDVHTCDMTMSRGDLLNGVCGCETWGALLIRQQQVVARSGMDDRVTFRYFSLTPKLRPSTNLGQKIDDFLAGRKVGSDILALIEDEKRVSDIVSGWRGTRRMNEFEQGWLRVRSMSPGVQPHGIRAADRGGWDDLSIPALSSDIRWHEGPFGRTLGVRSYVNGQGIDTAVRVLHAARMSDLHYPENGLPPWQAYAEQVRDASGRPFPVEWSISGKIISGADLAAQVELEMRIAHYSDRDYRQHNEIPPASTAKAIETAIDTRNQVTGGRELEAARFLGQVSVIVTGQATGGMTAEQVCEERAAALTTMFAGSGIQMDFAGADVQSDAVRATIPGEPIDMISYSRRMRLPYLAAGMPNVTSSIGDRRGPYLGYTRGASRTAVMCDPHYSTEGKSTGRQQNMDVIIGSLGAGKSVLEGAIAYYGVRRNIRTVISDPSGPLAVLCRMPELADVSQEVNLLNGKRGILSPPGLIRNPLLEEFDEPGQYAEAIEQAKAERRELAVDMAKRCLPEDLVAEGSHEARITQAALRLAARRHADAHGWETTSTLWDLVDNLDDEAVKGALIDASTVPLLRLLFPERGTTPDPGQYDKVLTVITTPGIVRAPDGVPRKDWSPMEFGADPVLRLVALFTDRLIYDKPRHQRCIAIFDEAETLTDSKPGKSMLSRLGRDHSKWNIYVALCVKSVNDQMLSGELKNFLARVFVGKMASTEPALAAMELLGLEDKRYVEKLLNLSTVQAGEFVVRDADGDVGEMKVDVDYHPALRAALLTDPRPAGSSAWDLAEEML